MDFWFKGINEDTSGCSFNETDIQKCPFLKNINKPTNFSFSSMSFPMPVSSSSPFYILLLEDSCIGVCVYILYACKHIKILNC